MKVQLNDIRKEKTYTGKEPKNHNPGFNHCRKLLEEGHDPKEKLEIYRGDNLAYTISSISWGATKTVRENEKRGPTMVNYRELPSIAFKRGNKAITVNAGCV